MNYNFDLIPDRYNSDSIKWHYFPPDVLPLWVADMDFPSPEPVIQALRDRVEHGIFGYPKEPDELRGVIVQRMADRYGWEIQPTDLVLLSGLIVGLNMTCHMVTQEAGCDPAEAAVLIQTPVYPPIYTANQHTGMQRQENELVRQPDGKYEIDFEAFEAAITPETKLFILCNPHNPVGRAFTRRELERMAEICLKHDLIICSDEIHSDLIFTGNQHIPIASIDPEVASRTITLISGTKTFNIAGLKCAYAVVQDAELMKRFERARMGLVGGVNLMGLTATLTAYREGQEWLDQLLKYLENNRDYLYRRICSEFPGVEMGLPEATYLAWLDFRGLGLAENPCHYFSREAKVGLNDGMLFGAPGTGYARLNFGCPRLLLEEALDKIKSVLPDPSEVS